MDSIEELPKRIIKFRCWHSGYKNKGVLQDVLPRMLYDESPGDCLTFFKQGQPVVLMQFTGLLDKNGKEIYEGDYLKLFGKMVASVVFQDFGGWSYNWIDPAYRSIRSMNPEPFFRNISLMEIVGNIYQNPVLKSEELSKERTPGHYWVQRKAREEREVAFWNMPRYWTFIGSQKHFSDVDMEWIGEIIQLEHGSK